MTSRPVDAPRRVAWDVMRAVDERDAYVNLLLPGLLRERGIVERDAAFATELTHGTIRRQGTYDAILDRVAGQGIDSIDPPVRDVLRLGCHQLLALRTPSHAAVSTSVDLVREVVGHRPTSFVNAILRKVARNDLAGWMDQVAPDRTRDLVGHLAVVHSHPRWVVEALDRALDAGPEELETLLAVDNEAPGVTLVARPGLCDLDELVGHEATPGRWSPYAAHLERGDPGAIDAVRTRRAGVQDEGSQLVALALSDAPLDGPDARWLDLCAGPGGKAALLAAIAAGRGAALHANEVQPHRSDLVARTLTGLLDARIWTTDGRTATFDGLQFDRVLVDAPCTGLGALRRRPEARWRRRPADLATLTALQRDLLDHAVELTRVGGVVAYATCSPHVAETLDVVSAVRERRGDLDVLDAPAVLPQVDALTGPFAQLWPHRHGTDAMFLALLRRR